MSDEGSLSLPTGWVATTVAAIANVVGGGTPPTEMESYWRGEIPWITSADIKDIRSVDIRKRITAEAIDRSATNLVPAGSIIVVTRVGLGKVALAPEALCYSQDSQGLLFDHDLMNALYLTYHLKDAVQIFKHVSRGTTISGVTKKQLQELALRVPPLREQHRIVEEIEKQFTRLDAAVAALERARANLKRYRASVLQAACEGRLVPTEAELARAEGREYEPADRLLDRILKDRRAKWEAGQLAKMQAEGKAPRDDTWKAKYKEPATPDASSLPTLPEGWTWTTASQLGHIQGGIQKQPKRAPRRNAFPFLRVANVLRGRLDLADVHKIELFGGELEKLRLAPGDLLIVEGNGSPSEIGRMAIWSGAVDDCVHQNHIIRMRPIPGVRPQYIESSWNSPSGAESVLRVASSTSGLYTLSASKVSGLLIPLAPVAEQDRIVAEVERRLSVIDDLDTIVEHNLKRADRLRQAVLKQAFEGKLVPQDPDDEPASMLLERIRAERSAAQAESSRRQGRGRIGRSKGIATVV